MAASMQRQQKYNEPMGESKNRMHDKLVGLFAFDGLVFLLRIIGVANRVQG